MPGRLGSRLLRLAALLAVPVLTGCSVSGTIEVRSSEEVAVDLMFTDVDFRQSPCNPHAYGPNFPLATIAGSDGQDRLTCRVTGVTHPSRLSRHAAITAVGEYLTFSYNPLAMGPDGRRPVGEFQRPELDQMAVTVSFPGSVLTTTGQPDGSRVTFTEQWLFDTSGGLQATALNHPGPAWSTVAGPIGFGLGVVAATAFWLARRSRTGPQSAPAGSVQEPAPQPSPADRAVGNGPARDDRLESGPEDRQEPSSLEPPKPRPPPPTAPHADDSRWRPPG